MADSDFDSQWGEGDAPFPGGIPDPIPQIDAPAEVIRDAIWRALGTPVPNRIYVSIQGDWWDMIAIRVYGKRRGNEHLMFRLIEANYPLREISNFPAGIAVIVPEIDVGVTIPLVPWKRAARIPTS